MRDQLWHKVLLWPERIVATWAEVEFVTLNNSVIVFEKLEAKEILPYDFYNRVDVS